MAVSKKKRPALSKKPIATDPQGRKIYMCSTKKIEQYAPFVRHVLGVVGHPEAFVTDGSCISDFCRDKKQLQRLCKLMGHQATYLVEGHTYIWEIAQALEGVANEWLKSAPTWILDLSLNINFKIGNKKRFMVLS